MIFHTSDPYSLLSLLRRWRILAAEKLMQLGAKVVSISDSNGVLVFKQGMSRDDWRSIIEVRCSLIHGQVFHQLQQNFSIAIIILVFFLSLSAKKFTEKGYPIWKAK